MSTTYTHAEIRGAILRAADRIEGDPGCYDFGSLFVPNACGTRGCMWGWIGFELGSLGGAQIASVSNIVVHDPMPGCLVRDGHLYDFCLAVGYDHGTATDAATALRAYADKYYPAVAEAAESAEVATRASVKQATGWMPNRLALATGEGVKS
jgi:hypothetical protein